MIRFQPAIGFLTLGQPRIKIENDSARPCVAFRATQGRQPRRHLLVWIRLRSHPPLMVYLRPECGLNGGHMRHDLKLDDGTTSIEANFKRVSHQIDALRTETCAL